MYIVLIAILAVMAYYILTAGNKGEKIVFSEFETKLLAGEIQSVYTVGGTAKVLVVNSNIPLSSFPNKADFYFTYSTGDVERISLLISEFNNDPENLAENKTIRYESDNPKQSFLESVMPYIYILLILVVGFALFRMLAQNNKGAMTFGKSKARISENVKIRFTDIAGADEEKEELKEIVDFLKSPQKFIELGARIPKGVLLVGPPGTGKTLLAKAVAGESNVPFFSISGSDFVEMFVGVGASRVRDLFDTAKRSMPCIIFIDEIDAVGRQRGAGLGGGNDEREQTLNQLLVEMDGFQANDGIIVLAATNRSDVLDPALLRPGRFDRQIYVHIPDVRGREGILRIHARNKPIEDGIDFKTIARITSGFTGADIENMLNEAAILAARAGRKKIVLKDLTEGINKVIMGPQKKSLLVTEKDKKITVFHEAGHAIVAKKMEHCDEVQEVSIIPRGQAAGYTMSRSDNDDQHVTYNMLCDRLSMIMGGRIAEEIVFGDISTGASNDIAKATEIARKMVTEWGMSKKLGFMSAGSSQEVFLGRDYQPHNLYSEKTASEIDDEIKQILTENYNRAKEILKANQGVMNEMASLLLDKETIYKDEVDMLIAGKTSKEVAQFMEEKEAKDKIQDEKNKKEFEEKKKVLVAESKLKTAEAFLKAGVITEEDFNKIKEETAQKKKDLEIAIEAQKIVESTMQKFEKENAEKFEKENAEKEESLKSLEDKIKNAKLSIENNENLDSTTKKISKPKSTEKISEKDKKDKKD
ncbi:MAG: ATP-dependent zinc metalloprotease FtsH [Clostridia bacterium]